LINLIKDYKPLLPVAIDMEDADGYKAKMGTLNNITLNTEICRYTCAELEKAGFYALVYANLDWTRTKLNMAVLAPYDLWLARWNANAPSRKCGMWQYTNSASVNGIASRVDMSKAYIDYPSLIKEHGLNGWKETEIPEEEENEFEKEWGHYVECVKPLQILWSDDTNYMIGFGADDKDSSFIANKKYFSKVI
jgi:GH25 family lysozyme M1 (1,4-beta-N-acetylmuramidase)